MYVCMYIYIYDIVVFLLLLLLLHFTDGIRAIEKISISVSTFTEAKADHNKHLLRTKLGEYWNILD